VVEWIGDLEHFSALREVWVKLEGVPPKWCDWKVFAQMASRIGLMLEVYWSSLFKSFHEHVRLKIACRCLEKIPIERLFELEKKLYLVNISVEGLEAMDHGGASGSGGGDDKGDGDDSSDENFDGLDDIPDQMETENKAVQTPKADLPSRAQQPRTDGKHKIIRQTAEVEIMM
jgi:hypothetical protein